MNILEPISKSPRVYRKNRFVIAINGYWFSIATHHNILRTAMDLRDSDYILGLQYKDPDDPLDSKGNLINVQIGFTGSVKKGESVKNGFYRELKEETNLYFRRDLDPKDVIHYDTSRKRWNVFKYPAPIREFTTRSTEGVKLDKVNEKAADSWVKVGGIIYGSITGFQNVYDTPSKLRIDSDGINNLVLVPAAYAKLMYEYLMDEQKRPARKSTFARKPTPDRKPNRQPARRNTQRR